MLAASSLEGPLGTVDDEFMGGMESGEMHLSAIEQTEIDHSGSDWDFHDSGGMDTSEYKFD